MQIILGGEGCANTGTAGGISMLWLPEDRYSGLQPIREVIECGQMGLTGEVDETILAWFDRGNDYKLGIQRRVEATHFWLDLGSGWTCINSILNFGVYDNFKSGKLGFVVATPSTTRMDDFGGGPSDTFVSQIYRRE